MKYKNKYHFATLIIPIVLFFCPDFAKTQNLYLANTDTENIGYYIPELTCLGFDYSINSNIYGYGILGYRHGTLFQSQKTGSKIYGMACVAPYVCADTFETWFYFYKANSYSEYLVPVDSARLNDAIPTAGMHLSYTDIYSNELMDSIFSVVEYFFDTPQQIEDNYVFGLAIGPRFFDPRWPSESFTYYPGRTAVVRRFGMADSVQPNPMMPTSFITYPGHFDYSRYRFFWGVFPITDSSMRITYEQELCKRTGLRDITATYISVRTFELSWSDPGHHCLYEVAYGPDSIPVEDYNVTTTTDTSFIVRSLNYEDHLAFRVRAACCLDDTTFWGQWSDTIRFSRPFYRLDVGVNDSTLGEAPGTGIYEQNETVTLAATPFPNAVFSTWDDGDTNRVRDLTLVCDSSVTAIFLPVEDTTHGGGNAITSASMPQVTVTPNPASGNVRVDVTTEGHCRIEFFDAAGRLRYARGFDGPAADIDISRLASGVWIVRITTPDGTTYRRLVVK